MIGYKLFRVVKDGSLAPLFINKRQRLQHDIWYNAEAHKTKGFAFRPGWHVMLQPYAPHLTEKGRVWKKVEVDNFRFFERPINQGGRWMLAQRMKIVGEL